MRPERFEFQCAPPPILAQGEKMSTVFEALKKIGVEFGCDLTTTTLRLRDAGNGNKFFAYSRISSV